SGTCGACASVVATISGVTMSGMISAGSDGAGEAMIASNVCWSGVDSIVCNVVGAVSTGAATNGSTGAGRGCAWGSIRAATTDSVICGCGAGSAATWACGCGAVTSTAGPGFSNEDIDICDGASGAIAGTDSKFGRFTLTG